MDRILIVLGTVLAAVATLLSVLLLMDEAAVDVGLVLTLGFGGATAIGVGLLTHR